MLGAAPPPAEHAWAPRESFRAKCPAILPLREAPGHRTGLPGRRLVEPGRFVEESLFEVDHPLLPHNGGGWKISLHSNTAGDKIPVSPRTPRKERKIHESHSHAF